MNPSENPEINRLDRAMDALLQSQKQLLTAQIIMGDRMDRLEHNLVVLSDKVNALADVVGQLAERQTRTDDKLGQLIDSQKHTDDKLDALADIVRQWIERRKNGN